MEGTQNEFTMLIFQEKFLNDFLQTRPLCRISGTFISRYVLHMMGALIHCLRVAPTLVIMFKSRMLLTTSSFRKMDRSWNPDRRQLLYCFGADQLLNAQQSLCDTVILL